MQAPKTALPHGLGVKFRMIPPSIRITVALVLTLFCLMLSSLSKAGACPVAEDVAERLLRLPFYNDFSEDDQKAVIAAIRSCAI